ncbi:hypothetical protein BJ508DRAFT_367325 [Ascobolus immersus RN42]|uniref:Uncharacterized protein n=1 Tax=Ascobolus immersus RN42 TaxID=1160509 RepID=A0A3N4HDE7_ASCIM|nr:hypothetical protein BJ508DRAFT_367325 [Ascobolus immersus RN42]
MSISNSPTSTVAFTPTSTRRSSISSQISNLTLTPRAESYDSVSSPSAERPSRYREFHTIVVREIQPPSSKSGKKYEFSVDQRLKVKVAEGEEGMACDEILGYLNLLEEYQISALVEYISIIEAESSWGTGLMLRHLSAQPTTDHLSSKASTIDLELVPTSHYATCRQFYLLRPKAYQTIRTAGYDYDSEDVYSFESRDWRYEPLGKDLLGIIKVKDNGLQCLSKNNNVQIEVLNWWDKTLVVLAQFVGRISREHFSGKELFVNFASLHDDDLCLKTVEVASVGGSSVLFSDVHILPQAMLFSHLLQGETLGRNNAVASQFATFSSEGSSEAFRPMHYREPNRLRLTVNSSADRVKSDTTYAVLSGRANMLQIQLSTLPYVGYTAQNRYSIGRDERKLIKGYIGNELAVARHYGSELMLSSIRLVATTCQLWSEDKSGPAVKRDLIGLQRCILTFEEV